MDMSKLGFKEGMTIMMMGAAEDKGLKEPTQKIVFYEDMTAAERAKILHEK